MFSSYFWPEEMRNAFPQKEPPLDGSRNAAGFQVDRSPAALRPEYSPTGIHYEPHTAARLLLFMTSAELIDADLTHVARARADSYGVPVEDNQDMPSGELGAYTTHDGFHGEH